MAEASRIDTRSVLEWKIGGEQGEGIDSCGDVLATVVTRMGYYAYGYKWFSSRIKGGHTNYKVRIGTTPMRSASPELHVLVALDQTSIDIESKELVPGGIVIADAQFRPALPAGRTDIHLVTVPLTQIAKTAGGILYRNMAALGSTAALLNLPLAAFHDYVAQKFGRKGDAVVAQNRTALEQAFEYAKRELGTASPFRLLHPSRPKAGMERLLMTGNDAIALGAVAAGCRFFAGYPITPATSVMETLVELFPKIGGVVVQAEDEIAAITMVNGAAYAGARAMTATSGPGLSLMQEGLGLASTAELPLVVVDCQRSGPSTGMPTKNEQSDILALIYGGHGESPRIVIAPSSPEEAFLDTQAAFNLADRLQCPIIIASDLGLAEWKYTVDPEDLPLDAVPVDRGRIASAEALADVPSGKFPRYEFTPDGVSLRSLPGMPHGQYLATGSEHNRFGKVSEDPKNRAEMMAKRWRKMELVDFTPYTIEGRSDGDLAIVAFGSSYGAVSAATAALNDAGIRTRHIHVRLLSPFPAEALEEALRGASQVLVVEANATGQLESLMRMNDAVNSSLVHSLRKYDGTLFEPEEIVEAARELVPAREEAVS